MALVNPKLFKTALSIWLSLLDSINNRSSGIKEGMIDIGKGKFTANNPYEDVPFAPPGYFNW